MADDDGRPTMAEALDVLRSEREARIAALEAENAALRAHTCMPPTLPCTCGTTAACPAHQPGWPRQGGIYVTTTR